MVTAGARRGNAIIEFQLTRCSAVVTFVRLLLMLLAMCLVQPAWARMYQWVDPDSGTTQLSGMPPAWYRSDEKGPRVFVFENGQVVDDTGIAVSDAERERLRRDAYIQSQQDQDAYLKKLLEAKRLKAVMQKKQGIEEESAPEEQPPPEQPVEAPPPAAEQGPNAEQLRALIDAWEKVRTENARQALDASAAAPDTAPAEVPETP